MLGRAACEAECEISRQCINFSSRPAHTNFVRSRFCERGLDFNSGPRIAHQVCHQSNISSSKPYFSEKTKFVLSGLLSVAFVQLVPRQDVLIGPVVEHQSIGFVSD